MKRGAGTTDITRRFTKIDRGADLRAFNREFIVVLTVYSFGKYQLVGEDSKSLICDPDSYKPFFNYWLLSLSSIDETISSAFWLFRTRGVLPSVLDSIP